MEKIITKENIRRFAYCNHGICKKPIRGIVVYFYGLGGQFLFDEDTAEGKMYGEKGILYLVPYQNPWAWMNRQTVALTDELLDVLFAACDLPEDTPIVSTGKSMGGLSALVYTAYAKRTPAACVTNCPVCDLPYHFTERPDLPRTLYSAFGTYEGTLEDALRSATPIHLVEQLPDIPYTIFHCEGDEAVNKQIHSDRFAEKLGSHHQLVYYVVPERGHCDLTEEMWQQYHQCTMAAMIPINSQNT